MKSGCITSHRLIKPNKSKVGRTHFYDAYRSHNLHHRELSLKKLSFAVLLSLLIPLTIAEAGFFSFFGDIFTKVNTQEKTINSQNVSLLAAAVGGPDMNSHDVLSEVNTVGESALLPDVGPSGGLADVSEGDYDRGQISVYVVREGDSLMTIAKMFDVSVSTLLWANNMDRGDKIIVGQTLAVLPVTGVQHTVKKGDTLEGIAKKYRGDPEEIRSYNDLAGNSSLTIGSIVIVPDGEMEQSSVKTVRAATSKLRGGGGPLYDGYYQAPLAHYRKTQGLHGYNGIDFGEYVGAPIMAAASGEVILARQGGYNGGYGNYVVIKHGNGTQTLYAHMLSVAVKAGTQVVQGQVIGYLGNTGRSTGPHLHFEVRGARNPF